MKMRFQKKTWLKLLSGVTLASALVVPTTVLASCSCSSIPEKPEPVKDAPDTSSITTFAAAKEFTKKYLEENYNMDLFNRDASYGIYSEAEKFKTQVENNGDEIKDFAFEFSAWEENKKVFLKGYFKAAGYNPKKNITSEFANTMNVQNAKMVPIFVLRDNVVHVEFAISYTYSNPSSSLTYNSLDELKKANSDWEQKIITNSLFTSYASDGDHTEKGEENIWVVIEDKSGGDYILKPDSSGNVIFSKNWTTFKLLTLPISFSNLKDVDSNLPPQ